MYGRVAKLFLESEFQRKGNKETKKRKNTNSQENLAVFLAATDSEIIIIQILHRKGQIKKMDRIVFVRTGTFLWNKFFPLRVEQGAASFLLEMNPF